MKAISRMMVLVVVFAMVAGSVLAAEMTYEEALAKVKADDYSAKSALYQAAREEFGSESNAKIIEDLKPVKLSNNAVGSIYMEALCHTKTDTPEVVEQEIRDVAAHIGAYPAYHLQALAHRSGDDEMKRRILAEGISKKKVHVLSGIMLAEQVDDPKMQVEAVKVACMQYAGNADLLAKQTLKLLSSVYAEGVISGENYLPENVCVVLIKQVVGASTARYQTLSSSSEASEKLSKGIQAWKALGADQFGIVWPE